MAGTVADLNNEGTNFSQGKDGIVVYNTLGTIPGGKTLDVTNFTPTVIREGHIVIEETATGILKPMPVAGAAYAALPAGHTYKGAVISTIETKKPFAGIAIRCAVNYAAAPYTMTSILAAIKTALPLINFTKD